MNDRFNKFLDYIFKVEGGYTNDKNDKGGATNFGITHEDAKTYLGYTGDMRKFKKSDVEKIYEKIYYKGNHLDKIVSDKINGFKAPLIIFEGVFVCIYKV